MDEHLRRTLRRWGVPAAVLTAALLFVWITSIIGGIDTVRKAIAHLHLGKLKLPPPVRGAVAFLLTSPWVGIAGVGFLHGMLYRRIRREVKQARRQGDIHEHDNVLWVDSGRNDAAGVPIILGPACPRLDRHPTDAEALYYRGIIGVNVAMDRDVVGVPTHELFCPVCQIQFLLGPRAKRIGDSRREVALLLAGRRIATR